MVQPFPNRVQNYISSLVLPSHDKGEHFFEILPGYLSELVVTEVSIDEANGLLSLSDAVNDLSHSSVVLKSD